MGDLVFPYNKVEDYRQQYEDEIDTLEQLEYDIPDTLEQLETIAETEYEHDLIRKLTVFMTTWIEIYSEDMKRRKRLEQEKVDYIKWKSENKF